VAVENTLLYENIERLLEGFVAAAATAIESRDPSTYGHSGRVADLSVALAEAVARNGHGAHHGLTFSRQQLRELRYASLLHDFGKVGVREQVLIKEKKLYPRSLDVIRLRFVALLREADVVFERERADHLARHGADGLPERLEELELARRETRARLDRYFHAVLAANEPTVLSEAGFEDLRRLSGLTFRDLDGDKEVLTGEELRWLTIRRGTLDEAERREIESHVNHTYRFLQQIPWTPELQHVPDIAYGHHEKLNGRGYPRGLHASAIPVQTRIMAIADIYDALTAADRPYKRAVSPERALDILRGEADAGELDADLLATFIEARLYDP
jgi:response regulator RpfG family c-di-GMP phosphodiesterase